jgi:hypothetical protein
MRLGWEGRCGGQARCSSSAPRGKPWLPTAMVAQVQVNMRCIFHPLNSGIFLLQQLGLNTHCDARRPLHFSETQFHTCNMGQRENLLGSREKVYRVSMEKR